MYLNAHILSVDIFIDTINRIKSLVAEVENSNNNLVNEALLKLSSAEDEMRISSGLLNKAIFDLNVAISEKVVACSSLDPFWCASATKKVFEATICKEKMEKRYRLSEKCVSIASAALDEVRSKTLYYLKEIEYISNFNIQRLLKMEEDIRRYLSRVDTKNAVNSKENEKIEVSENSVLRPDMIYKLLNISYEEMILMLNLEMSLDINFANRIIEYRNQYVKGDENLVLKKNIVTNLTGYLGEMIVRNAFRPFCNYIETQKVTMLPEGSYTKTDLIFKEIKVPIILGRGKGMAALTGEDLAVEVKTGKKEYIRSQLSHMQTQAMGHQESSISCTIVSKNIRDLSKSTERLVRDGMNEAGSRILAMLPRKEDLDQVCIDFIFKEK